MEPFFTEEQLNNMSRENLIEIMKIMKEQSAKKDTEIQLLKDKQKELEFMNAMLSDRLALARRKQFGSSSEKYAEGYEQMDLFNEAVRNVPSRISLSAAGTGSLPKVSGEQMPVLLFTVSRKQLS